MGFSHLFINVSSQKNPQVHTQLTITQISREKPNWGKNNLNAKPRLLPRISNPALFLPDCPHPPVPLGMAVSRSPDLKVLVTGSLVSELRKSVLQPR